jgi:hypothetical protein
MTERDVGPNLQRTNTETEAETEVETEAGTEAETDTEERNGNTEDRVLVQGETSYMYKKMERGVGNRRKKERHRERKGSLVK